LNFLINGHASRARCAGGVKPAGAYTGCQAAAHITGKRIANDHYLVAANISDGGKHVVKEDRARLLRPDLVRNKYPVKNLPQVGVRQLFALGNAGAVCASAP
jgi:hypothetical protein